MNLYVVVLDWMAHRFHELAEFDETKRSCRKTLARRKTRTDMSLGGD